MPRNRSTTAVLMMVNAAPLNLPSCTLTFCTCAHVIAVLEPHRLVCNGACRRCVDVCAQARTAAWRFLVAIVLQRKDHQPAACCFMVQKCSFFMLPCVANGCSTATQGVAATSRGWLRARAFRSTAPLILAEHSPLTLQLRLQLWQPNLCNTISILPSSSS